MNPKIFYVIDEAFPLYKIGGLGDVGGSLPKALKATGTDIALILPKHPEIVLDSGWQQVSQCSIEYGQEMLPVIVWQGKLPGSQVDTYLIEEKKYISEKTDASDNHADKFSVFSLAVCSWVNQLSPDMRPSIMHLNDWHTALIPVIDKHLLHVSETKYIVSIHNLKYQGITTTPVIEKLRLPVDACQIITMDTMDHDTNILLEGLLHADCISTVSERYAQEIITSEYGEKIDEILKLRQKDIIGIQNGIDTSTFDPATDPMIFQNYTITNAIAGKKANKRRLQNDLGLPERDACLLSFVGRVDPQQKGIELIIEALKQNNLIENEEQFVFLGVGDPTQEQAVRDVASHNQNIKIITKFDEALSRKIYASSDLMLIPSKFEPCGLVQMIANRYGAIPIVRATGGLADTITNGQNGFTFEQYDWQEMVSVLKNAKTQTKDVVVQQRMINTAMSKDFSWSKPATKYNNLYQSLMQ